MFSLHLALFLKHHQQSQQSHVPNSLLVSLSADNEGSDHFAGWVKISADDILKYISYFSPKTRFEIPCKLSSKETIHMIFQICLGINIYSLLFGEIFTHKTLKLNKTI